MASIPEVLAWNMHEVAGAVGELYNAAALVRFTGDSLYVAENWEGEAAQAAKGATQKGTEASSRLQKMLSDAGNGIIAQAEIIQQSQDAIRAIQARLEDLSNQIPQEVVQGRFIMTDDGKLEAPDIDFLQRVTTLLQNGEQLAKRNAFLRQREEAEALCEQARKAWDEALEADKRMGAAIRVATDTDDALGRWQSEAWDRITGAGRFVKAAVVEPIQGIQGLERGIRTLSPTSVLTIGTDEYIHQWKNFGSAALTIGGMLKDDKAGLLYQIVDGERYQNDPQSWLGAFLGEGVLGALTAGAGKGMLVSHRATSIDRVVDKLRASELPWSGVANSEAHLMAFRTATALRAHGGAVMPKESAGSASRIAAIHQDIKTIYPDLDDEDVGLLAVAKYQHLTRRATIAKSNGTHKKLETPNTAAEHLRQAALPYRDSTGEVYGLNIVHGGELLASYVPYRHKGAFTVEIHGNPSEVGMSPKGSVPGISGLENVSATPEELAEVIKSSAWGKEPQRVFLQSCSTGACEGGTAQRLADALNVDVVAGNDYVWLTQSGDLPAVTGIDGNVPVMPPTGEYKRFSPVGGVLNDKGTWTPEEVAELNRQMLANAEAK